MPEVTKMPTGEYPKSAKSHHLNLEAAAAELKAKLPGSRRQTKSLARESGVSVIMMAMEAGDAIEEHSAPGVVTVQLVDGHAILVADGETFDLRPGEMLLFQPGVVHNVRAEEQSVVVLTVTGGAQ